MPETTRYTVLINDEEQYSLWLKELKVPDGWTSLGFEGTRAECREFVDRRWTDLRPKSLRERMGGAPAESADD